MIPNPNSVSIIAALFGILFFIILTLLPSIIELKRPKDPGPKIIKDYDYETLHDLDVETNLVESNNDMEITLEAGNLILKEITVVLAALPNLES